MYFFIDIQVNEFFIIYIPCFHRLTIKKFIRRSYKPVIGYWFQQIVNNIQFITLIA
jgi:hypothetical protein